MEIGGATGRGCWGNMQDTKISFSKSTDKGVKEYCCKKRSGSFCDDPDVKKKYTIPLFNLGMPAWNPRTCNEALAEESSPVTLHGMLPTTVDEDTHAEDDAEEAEEMPLDGWGTQQADWDTEHEKEWWEVTDLFPMVDGSREKTAMIGGMEHLCCCHESDLFPGVDCVLEGRADLNARQMRDSTHQRKSDCGRKGDGWHSFVHFLGEGGVRWIFDYGRRQKYQDKEWVGHCLVSKPNWRNFVNTLGSAGRADVRKRNKEWKPEWVDLTDDTEPPVP
eukprot:TRINITY_DN47472_c0_g1_i2.p1 TRINITY_DN47472_c0_g1~~TRINITY_DN47472_c0_g1_i2.p1  ORF type:complete len:276 (-),score=53.34 TRINITY_DN47472_c0_g1_i2:68-895(-)